MISGAEVAQHNRALAISANLSRFITGIDIYQRSTAHWPSLPAFVDCSSYVASCSSCYEAPFGRHMQGQCFDLPLGFSTSRSPAVSFSFVCVPAYRPISQPLSLVLELSSTKYRLRHHLTKGFRQVKGFKRRCCCFHVVVIKAKEAKKYCN